jgi:hypothetical protein
VKIFVDLDRTLLDTNALVMGIWDFLANEYGVDSVAEKAKAKQFFTHIGDLYDYDFFGHLETLGINRTDQVVHRMIKYLRGLPLLFSDSMASLAMMQTIGEIEILTFGNEPYQKFKLATLPDLDTIPVVIVRNHKGEYLSRISEPCVLIDDKDIADQMPGNVTFILLDRTQSIAVMDHGDYKSIRSLINIIDVLKIRRVHNFA